MDSDYYHQDQFDLAMRPVDNGKYNVLQDGTWHLLAGTSLPGESGGSGHVAERAAARLLGSVGDLKLPPAYLNKLKETLVEAMQNAMKQNNQVGTTLPVIIRVYTQTRNVEDSQQGTDGIPEEQRELVPDPTLSSRYALDDGKHPQAGWGYFLIERIVTDPSVSVEELYYSIELFLHTEG